MPTYGTGSDVLLSNHWHAIVAVILAVGVMAAIVILAVSELDHGTAGHISEAETTLLATVLGAGVGAIATYLGTRDEDPGPVGETQLVTRWPAESRLRAPFDQDATAEYPPADEGNGADH